MISIIVSCMNRTQNLLESIASWVDSHKYIDDIIVVDWSSSIPVFDNKIIKKYLLDQKIKLLRVEDQKFYSIAKANNFAFSNAKNNIVLKIDADYKLINSSWLDNIFLYKNKLIFDADNKKYFIHGHWSFSESLTGFLLINKEDFLFYNENMTGWGYEDTDLYNRVSSSGVFPIIFFNIKDYIKHLDHTEDDRVCNYENKNKKESHNKNFFIGLKNKPFNISKFETILNSDGYKVLKEIQ